MPDILAIVSKAVFERDARVDGRMIEAGDIWRVDRYTSANKALSGLAAGGRIFLVTVRPPNEQLWFVGVVDRPTFDGSAWVAKPNALPATNISSLRKAIKFESGKGISSDKGTLGMSLQTPRALTAQDVELILASLGASVAPRKPTPAPARVIGGKYEVLRQLGKGGMGVVYEARHTGTGRRVAIKEIIDDDLKKDPKLLERFWREARATAAIDTRHVVPVLDTGSDPHPYLVMELLQGEDLQDLIVRSGTLREPVALRVVAQACAGLVRAHEAGVIHRDIKPANLFLARRDGEVTVKLLDFGVARVKAGLGGVTRLTTTGVMLGTPLYMSPEQVMGAKDLDHRADVWSLGVVLYEALVGATPHEEVETLGALLVAICGKPAKPLRALNAEVSEHTAAIVERALAIDPAKRYQSAAHLLDDLRAALPNGLALDESSFGALPSREFWDELPFENTSAT